MSEVLDRIVTSREAAHEAVKLAYAHAQCVIANGKPVRIVAKEQEDDRSLRQNRFYWGPCLKEISQQAVVDGRRYDDDAWHEYFRREFLGYEIERYRVAGRKRDTVIRRLKSTAKLKVKEFTVYLTKLQAYAATELGVEFSVPDWQEYRG